MRQADSTIKGYLYQFNKSILEVLRMSSDASAVVEGIIEDIDILSPTSITTLQCKYHEDKRFTISDVAIPIIEMLCNYCETSYVGKDIQYILYAYYNDNVDNIELSDFLDYLNTTQDKEILTKYFHRIYNISETIILDISNKAKKTTSDKEVLISYYKANRRNLVLRVNIEDFWNRFRFIKAVKFDRLKASVLEELCKLTDQETASSLYYPNALSYIALLSAKKTKEDRTVFKEQLISFLAQQKTILLKRWVLEAVDRKRILRAKRKSLSPFFATNSDIRVLVFSDGFLDKNKELIIPFIREYLGKYYRKPKLQKPPIFVFGNKSLDIMQNVIMELYKYQQPVNTGMVGTQFVEDSFIKDTNCSSNYVCKITQFDKISSNLLELCNVNQLYIVGVIDNSLENSNYYVESLEVCSINELRYLVSLSKNLEE